MRLPPREVTINRKTKKLNHTPFAVASRYFSKPRPSLLVLRASRPSAVLSLGHEWRATVPKHHLPVLGLSSFSLRPHWMQPSLPFSISLFCCFWNFDPTSLVCVASRSFDINHRSLTHVTRSTVQTLSGRLMPKHGVSAKPEHRRHGLHSIRTLCLSVTLSPRRASHTVHTSVLPLVSQDSTPSTLAAFAFSRFMYDHPKILHLAAPPRYPMTPSAGAARSPAHAKGHLLSAPDLSIPKTFRANALSPCPAATCHGETHLISTSST